ncbi:hypothetical protein HDV00_006731 [Rhizophlyctis rosea]|nr:hypothetical protein HDV00_006731 [Rhizophlyctis rosea]
MQASTATIHSLPEETIRHIARFLPLADCKALRRVNRSARTYLEIKFCLRQHVPLYEELWKVGGDDFALSLFKFRSWGSWAPVTVAAQLAHNRPNNLLHWLSAAVSTRNSQMLVFVLEELKVFPGSHDAVLSTLGESMSEAAGCGWLFGVMPFVSTMEHVLWKNIEHFRRRGVMFGMFLAQALDESIASAAEGQHFGIVDYLLKAATSVLRDTDMCHWFCELAVKLSARVDRRTLLKCVEIGRGRGAFRSDRDNNGQYYPILDPILSEDDPSVIPFVLRTNDNIPHRTQRDLLVEIATRAIKPGYVRVMEEALIRLDRTFQSTDGNSRSTEVYWIFQAALDAFDTAVKLDYLDSITECEPILRVCLRSPLFSELVPEELERAVHLYKAPLIREFLDAFPEETRICIRSAANQFPSPPTLELVELLVQNGWKGDLVRCERFVEGLAFNVERGVEEEEEGAVNARYFVKGLAADAGVNGWGVVAGGTDAKFTTFRDDQWVRVEELHGILQLLAGHCLDVTDECLLIRTVRNCFRVGNDRITQIVITALKEAGAAIDAVVVGKVLGAASTEAYRELHNRFCVASSQPSGKPESPKRPAKYPRRGLRQGIEVAKRGLLRGGVGERFNKLIWRKGLVDRKVTVRGRERCGDVLVRCADGAPSFPGWRRLMGGNRL